MNQQNVYESQFRKWLDAIRPNLWDHLEDIASLPAEAQTAIVAYALELACISQNAANITLGRSVLQRLPRPWLLQRMEAAAEAVLSDSDPEWTFRRLFELYSALDEKLLTRLLERAERHENADVRELASEFRPE
jgi:hypothetical protein